MFYDNFVRLSNSIGKSPSAVALECGLSKPTVTKWKNGGKPTTATAQKIADYFGVTTDYLLAGEKKEKPLPERKQLRSIARLEDSEKITPELDEQISDFIDFLLREDGKQ